MGLDKTSDIIKKNLNNYKELESVYRKDKKRFKKAINSLHGKVDNKVIEVWYNRLNFETERTFTINKKEILIVILLGLFSGFISKTPDIFNLEWYTFNPEGFKINDVTEETFYSRNISFIIFPALCFYYFLKDKFSIKYLVIYSLILIISSLFINSFPYDENSDVFDLILLHMPIFSWLIFGLSYLGNDLKDPLKRLNFLRLNGDFIIVGGVIFLSGLLFSGITISLFEIIGIDIAENYFDYFGIWALSSLPVVTVFVVTKIPDLVKKVSSLIANIFTPLVVLMLILYLPSMFFSEFDPFKDRDSLMTMNILNISVMALVVFSLSSFKDLVSNFKINSVLALSVLTIIVNIVCLVAIVGRLFDMGFTPNRLTVLGANLLILINLFYVFFSLVKGKSNEDKVINVKHSIGKYLPIYGIWFAIVIFILPLLFS